MTDPRESSIWKPLTQRTVPFATRNSNLNSDRKLWPTRRPDTGSHERLEYEFLTFGKPMGQRWLRCTGFPDVLAVVADEW